ncbi:MAG: 50S ribosomal protein L11 methyltransferase [Opitutaceae bacterium]
MALTEIRVEIAPDSAEAADDALFEETSGRWIVLEDSVALRAWMVGIFNSRKEAEKAWKRVAFLAAVRPVGAPAVRRLVEGEWQESYKAHFKPSRFGRLHWVPIWEKENYRIPPKDAALWLDPGLAFGTGNHETTRLCCKRLVAFAEKRRLPEGCRPQGRNGDRSTRSAARSSGLAAGRVPAPRFGRVIDAGCGSGILALSAALLGFDAVIGFDVDPDAVRVSRENAELNGLGSKVKFLAADLAAGLRGRRADLVLANIQADVLAANAGPLAAAVAPGGALVLSGILTRELGAVRSAFAGVCEAWRSDSRTLGEWSDLVGIRPAPNGRARR